MLTLSVSIVIFGFIIVLVGWIYNFNGDLFTMFIGTVLMVLGIIILPSEKRTSQNIRCVSEIDHNDIKTYDNCWFSKNVIQCKEYRIIMPQNYKCTIEKQMEKN